MFDSDNQLPEFLAQGPPVGYVSPFIRDLYEEHGVELVMSATPEVETDQTDAPPPSHVVMFPIDKITIDERAQTRVNGLDDATVAQYALDLENGSVFPPIVVLWDDSTYWLGAGFHRIAAYKRRGVEQVQAVIKPGGLREARFENYHANNKHGLQIDEQTRRAHLFWLLCDSEWMRRSDSWLAEETGISDKTIKRIREEHRKLRSCGINPETYSEQVNQVKNLRESGKWESIPEPEPQETVGRDGKTRKPRKKRSRSREENLRIFSAPPKWMSQEYEELPLIAQNDPKPHESLQQKFTEAHAVMLQLSAQFPNADDLFAAPWFSDLSDSAKQELTNCLIVVTTDFAEFGTAVTRFADRNGLLLELPKVDE